MGHPIHHSLSPEIFSFLSGILKVPVIYRKLDIPPIELISSVRILKKLPLLEGWNVTLPHKEAILSSIDILSPECEATGAVNVVKVSQNKLYGFNTDIPGVLQTFKEHRIRIQGRSALVFGAGGASAAVGTVLGKEGASRVWIVNRTLSRARKISRSLQKRFPATEFKVLPPERMSGFIEPVALYVNATPLGMKGFPKQTYLPKKLTPGSFAFDLIYRPGVTSFIQEAAERGLKTLNGLDMLCWQALFTWEIWVEEIVHKTRIKRLLKNHLEMCMRKDRL